MGEDEQAEIAVPTAELAQGQVLAEAAIMALAYATHQLTDQFTELMETIYVIVERK
jgi:hypothetical protein